MSSSTLNAHAAFLEATTPGLRTIFGYQRAKYMRGGAFLETYTYDREDIILKRLAEAALTQDFEKLFVWQNTPISASVHLTSDICPVHSSIVVSYDEDMDVRIMITNTLAASSGQDNRVQLLDLEISSRGRLQQFSMQGMIDWRNAISANTRRAPEDKMPADKLHEYLKTSVPMIAKWDDHWNQKDSGENLLVNEDIAFAELKAFVLTSVTGMYEGKFPDFTQIQGLTNVRFYPPGDLVRASNNAAVPQVPHL